MTGIVMKTIAMIFQCKRLRHREILQRMRKERVKTATRTGKPIFRPVNNETSTDFLAHDVNFVIVTLMCFAQ